MRKAATGVFLEVMSYRCFREWVELFVFSSHEIGLQQIPTVAVVLKLALCHHHDHDKDNDDEDVDCVVVEDENDENENS